MRKLFNNPKVGDKIYLINNGVESKQKIVELPQNQYGFHHATYIDLIARDN